MEHEQDSIDPRLEQAARQWQALRYMGPVPDFEPAPRSYPLAWAGAFAVALVLFFAWPSASPWPDTLRPVVRGSPFEVAAPSPPPQGFAFRLPDAPSRPSCFSQADACDQPAG